MLLLILFLFANSLVFGSPNNLLHSNNDSLGVKQDSLHLIEKGETLYGIALKYGIKVSELQAINQLQDDHIETGQQLIIPVIEALAKKDTLVILKDSIYTVQKGDVLSTIATKHELNTKDLVIWNKLESADKIYPNQSIKLYPTIKVELDTLQVEKEVPIAVVKVDTTQTVLPDTLKIEETLVKSADTLDKVVEETVDVANHNKLDYDFTPSGIKTAVNVFVLLLLLVVFIYNINK